jgi:GNAT superfamily N-acetyltransferase
VEAETPICVRDREAADLDQCVAALAAVHQTSGYPTNWPGDPARWLTPSGILRAWIAASGELPVAGHVILREAAAGAPAGPAEAGPASAGPGPARPVVARPVVARPVAAGPVAEVSRLFVVPAARRQGVARMLLQEAADWAAASGLDLVLEVTDHLRAARALYEQTGFRLVSTAQADWTTPDGQPVTLHHYVRRRDA